MATGHATTTGSAAGGSTGGLWSWITTVDHKRIGILYGVTALVFFLVGGVEALLIRIQLARPAMEFLSAEAYNQIFTMHGTTMVFLVAMPAAVALFNFIVPLQIGARDVAFPRLNALSYWIFLFGGIFLNISLMFGVAPNGGWFGYVPLTTEQYTPGPNIDFWVLGLQILGIASIMGGVNFITTVINLRAPGMKLMRMPLFSWMTLVTSFLLITALPVLAVALFFLTFDRFWGTTFYVVQAGADPALWQHLFWLFGHPEVYILILPAFGIMSEVIPAFSRKPLFGYALVVYSGVLIGFIGWGVWAHHMFATGQGPIADSFFAVGSMIIAIPTGVKIFNWLGTMWGGSLRFRVPMLYAIGFIAMFTVGGISGIMHAAAPSDLQQTDTYFVVAHLHYVIFGGVILGLLAGLHYWYPKMTGRMMNRRLGLWTFWFIFLGSNLTFFPMHFAGLLGMPRRIFTYPEALNLGSFNLLSTAGAFLQGAGVLLLVWNLYRSRKRGEPAGPNPWEAHTLEWATDSPPAHYNFAQVPNVHSREPMWEEPDAMRREASELRGGEPRMPSPSYWPILTAVGIVATFALFFLVGEAPRVGTNEIAMPERWWAPLVGFAFMAVAVVNWAFEPAFRDEH